MPLVIERLPATATLAVVAIVLACAIAFPLGLLGATRHGSAWDYLATGVSMVTVSTPSFWLGILLILFFAGQLRWLPASGAGGFNHVILPAVALSAYSIGLITRLVRATMLDVMRQQYVMTARAKGLARRLVTARHGLRNALLPIVTIVGLQFGSLLGGSVIIETVFAWPGVGWLLIQAINARDLPLVRADVMVIALLFVIINVGTDLVYSYIDPRIRFA
jgi:ABC-type dipeptide/oligopeptide/nickel transport system permease component